MKKILISISLILIVTALFSQQWRIATFTTENGFPTDMIKTVVSDTNNFIWVGTDYGLVRFDGDKSDSYKNFPQLFYLKHLMQKKNGQILVVADNGLISINSKPDTVTYELTAVSGDANFLPNFPKSAIEDKNGNIWFSEADKVCKIENKVIKKYNFTPSDYSKSLTNSFSLLVDSFGNFWVASIPGNLFYFSYKDDKFIKVPLKNSPFGNVLSMISPCENEIWISSNKGIYQITITENCEIISEKLIPLEIGISCMAGDYNSGILFGTFSAGVYETDFSDNNNITFQKIDLINSGQINQIYRGKNEWWICSNEGLILLEEQYFNNLPLISNKNASYNDFMIQSICESENNSVFFLTGTDIFKYDRLNWTANSIFNNKFEDFSPLRAVAKNDEVWIADVESKVFRYNLNYEKLTEVTNTGKGIFTTSMEIDQEKNIWITQNAVNGSLLFRIDENLVAEYYETPIFADVIKIDNTGNLYAAGGFNNMKSSYLVKYNAERNLFEDVSFENKFHFFVYDFCFDKDNNIWFATNKGLYRQSGTLLEKIEIEEISDDQILNSVAVTSDGSIWFANAKGLFLYKNNYCSPYKKSNGLLANTIQPRNLYVDSKNNLWVGTAKGVVCLQDNKSENAKTPSPAILSLKVNGEKYSLTNSIENQVFDYKSYLEFDYKSLIYPTSEVIYKIKISGINVNYEITDKTNFFIHDLKNGDYELHISALKTGENYDWSDETVFKFTVSNIWYREWWAILLFIFIFIILVYFVVKIYSKKLKNEKQELEKIIELRTSEIVKHQDEILAQKKELAELNEDLAKKIDERTKELTNLNTKLINLEKENIQSQFDMLKQQVNPHFLFNSLNVLTSLIKFEPDLAEKFSEHLSKVYRYVLENKDNELVELSTELNFLDAYVFLLNIRFLGKLKININISEESKKDKIIPLALQLLIENAIKHNTMSKLEPLVIEIFIDENNMLNIINNLQERPTQIISTGVGLKNIQNRYLLLNKTFLVFEKTENQFIAKIPLIRY